MPLGLHFTLNTNMHYVRCSSQRMWTLQEFCSGNSPLVVVQPGDADQESGEATIDNMEGIYSEAQRVSHIASQHQILHVWLCSSVQSAVESIEFPEQVYKTYLALSQSRFCLLPSDSVRAL